MIDILHCSDGQTNTHVLITCHHPIVQLRQSWDCNFNFGKSWPTCRMLINRTPSNGACQNRSALISKCSTLPTPRPSSIAPNAPRVEEELSEAQDSNETYGCTIAVHWSWNGDMYNCTFWRSIIETTGLLETPSSNLLNLFMYGHTVTEHLDGDCK